jgi:hypothetical protein
MTFKGGFGTIIAGEDDNGILFQTFGWEEIKKATNLALVLVLPRFSPHPHCRKSTRDLRKIALHNPCGSTTLRYCISQRL